MDPLEQKLAEMRLAPPSERLDERLDETFRTARKMGRDKHRIGFLWWIGATTTVGVAATVLLLASFRTAPIKPTPVVYRIEAKGGLREMLLNSDAIQVEPTSFELRVETHGSKDQ
jgi:hypothetical protein